MPFQQKYFYVEDDTAILFAANGTPLIGLMAALSNVVTVLKFPFPTYPMWFYFFGLIFAFISKLMIQLINSDQRQREKLQHARDFVLHAKESPFLTPELEESLDRGWEKADIQYAKLLKENHGPVIDSIRAWSFFLSAFCFLISTSSLIWLAGSAIERGINLK